MFTQKEETKTNQRLGVIILKNIPDNPGALNNSLQITDELQKYISSKTIFSNIILEQDDVYQENVGDVSVEKFDVKNLLTRMNDNMNSNKYYSMYIIITAGEYGVNALKKFYALKDDLKKPFEVFFSGHLVFKDLSNIIKQGCINYIILPAHIVNHLKNETKKLLNENTKLYIHDTGVPHNRRLEDMKQCREAFIAKEMIFDIPKAIVLFLGGDAHNAQGIKQIFEKTQAEKIIVYAKEQAIKNKAVLYVHSIGRTTPEIEEYCKRLVMQTENSIYLRKDENTYKALLAYLYDDTSQTVAIVTGDQTSSVTEVNDFANQMVIMRVSSMKDIEREKQADLFLHNSYAQVLNADKELLYDINFGAIKQSKKPGYDINTHNIVQNDLGKNCLESIQQKLKKKQEHSNLL